jgi:minor extracellular serine protease Vpr
MASPHVAGAVALLLDADPHIRATDVRTILQNAADPHLWALGPQYGLLDSVHLQGAGMLDIDDAILAQAFVSPGKISLGESQAGPKTVPVRIQNKTRETRTYRLSIEHSVATAGSDFTPGFWYDEAVVAADRWMVTLPPRGSATVNVTISAPQGLPDGAVYGGYLVFTPVNQEGYAYRVPFAGYKGDYQAVQVLTDAGCGLPWLARLSGDTFNMAPDMAIFTLQHGDIPYFLIHFDHQSRLFHMEVKEALTGRTVGLAQEDEHYLGRNSTPDGFWAYAWDGNLVKLDRRRTEST